MEVLSDEVKEFLETIGLKGVGATNSFLASNTADLASKYEEWRDQTGKGALKGTSAKGIVYSWKQDVTRRQRENIRRLEEMSEGTEGAKAVAGVVEAVSTPSASGSDSSMQQISKVNISKKKNNGTTMRTPTVVASQNEEAPSAKKKRIRDTPPGSKPPTSSSKLTLASPPSSSLSLSSFTAVSKVIPVARPQTTISSVLVHNDGGPSILTTTTTTISSVVVNNKGGESILSTTICSDPHSGSDSEKNIDEDELVWRPENHDVLSGRGGATNQHVGNEWYRRLVRCSAGFYRTCPKHTKLMVAKSVVAAIKKQNPPGRFLEVDTQTGAYKQMPHKRAVDKASQALRERWDRNPADGSLQEIMTELFNSTLNSTLETARAGSVNPRDSIAHAVDMAVWRVALEVSNAMDWHLPANSAAAPNSRPTTQGVSDDPAAKKATTKSSKSTDRVVGSMKVSSKKKVTASVEGEKATVSGTEEPKSTVIRKGPNVFSIKSASVSSSKVNSGVTDGIHKVGASGKPSKPSGRKETSATTAPKTASVGKSKSSMVRKAGPVSSSSGPSKVSTARPKLIVPKKLPKSSIAPRAAALSTVGSRDVDKLPMSVTSRPIVSGREDSFGSPNFIYPSSSRKEKSNSVTPATTSSFVDLPSSFDTATIASLSPSFDAATENALSPSFEVAAGLSSDGHDDDEGCSPVATQGVKRKSGTRSKETSSGGASRTKATTSVKKSRKNENPVISPFHREILAMKFQRIID